MSGLTNDAKQFAVEVAQGTGLNVGVVEAWVAQESAYGNSPAGQFNFLNLRGQGGGFASYGSVNQAAQAVVHQLQVAPEWYGGILKSAGQSPQEQIAAIASSPWDAGHYGGDGGPNLVNTYDSMLGQSVTPKNSGQNSGQNSLMDASQTLAQALATHFNLPNPQSAATTLYSIAQDLQGSLAQSSNQLNPPASQNEQADAMGGKFDAPVQSLTNLMQGWQPEDPGSSTENADQPQNEKAVASGG